MALALRYLHSNGVVYRDLKSDNVLVWSLDPNDVINVKLADYGISRFANPGGVKGEEGTPGYLAPEAIRRRGEDQAFDEKVCIIWKKQKPKKIYYPFCHSMYIGGHLLVRHAAV